MEAPAYPVLLNMRGVSRLRMDVMTTADGYYIGLETLQELYPSSKPHVDLRFWVVKALRSQHEISHQQDLV
jgi:hypothetical protein